MNRFWQMSRRYLGVTLFVLLCQASLAFAITNLMKEAVLHRDAAITRKLLQAGATASLGSNQQPSEPAYEEYGQRLVNLPGVVRANVYGTDGFIRFSTDKNLLGLKFKDNEELAEAFKGRTKISIEQVSATDKAEHVALGRLGGADGELIEAYIPLLDAAGSPLAVVEYYQRPVDLQQNLSATFVKIWLACLTATFAILLALLALQRKAGFTNRHPL